jgi:hypothetical protein
VNPTRLPPIQNHHHLALQDVRDKMVVMQDGGDLVTILPCSQISWQVANIYKTKIDIVCHIPKAYYLRKLYCYDFFNHKKKKTNRPTEFAKLSKKHFFVWNPTRVYAHPA